MLIPVLLQHWTLISLDVWQLFMVSDEGTSTLCWLISQPLISFILLLLTLSTTSTDEIRTVLSFGKVIHCNVTNSMGMHAWNVECFELYVSETCTSLKIKYVNLESAAAILFFRIWVFFLLTFTASKNIDRCMVSEFDLRQHIHLWLGGMTRICDFTKP